MFSFTRHFQSRSARDELDVIPVLWAGLVDPTHRQAITFDGHAIGGEELRRRVAYIQERLTATGLTPGRSVAVMLANSLDHIALIYALILLGVIWVPINVRLRGAALAHVLRDSAPDALVLGSEFRDGLPGDSTIAIIGPEALFPSSAGELDARPLIANQEIKPSDTLCVIYTSGTTGAAKGVVFTHRMLRVASEAALLVAQLGPGDRAFLWEPLCHIGGAQMLMVPFLVEVELHVVERFSASKFWHQWTTAQATHLHYLGGILDVLAKQPASGEAPYPSIRVAWGAGLSATIWNEIQKRFGCVLRECYGMTEGSSFATLNTTGTPGSIGAPLPWIQLELVDEAGRSVPRGAIGEIVLSSEVDGVIFPGYLNNQDATETALRDGRLFTGDLARELDGGEYAFVGRRTDSMRVRGENVSAWEVERVFVDHPAVKAAAALGVPAAVGEQDILLYVQFEPAATATWQDLLAWAHPQLASFQLPRYFAAVDGFDLTPSERIRKHLLSRDTQSTWDRDAIPRLRKSGSSR